MLFGVLKAIKPDDNVSLGIKSDADSSWATDMEGNGDFSVFHMVEIYWEDIPVTQNVAAVLGENFEPSDS